MALEADPEVELADPDDPAPDSRLMFPVGVSITLVTGGGGGGGRASTILPAAAAWMTDTPLGVTLAMDEAVPLMTEASATELELLLPSSDEEKQAAACAAAACRPSFRPPRASCWATPTLPLAAAPNR